MLGVILCDTNFGVSQQQIDMRTRCTLSTAKCAWATTSIRA